MTEPQSRSVDPAICPLCGQPNECVRAGGSTAECWCTHTVIPRELLARIDQESKDRACLCRACVEKAAPTHRP